MIPVRYHEAAEEELLTEIAYLESRAAGLGRRFFGDIRKAEDSIAALPKAAPEILPGIRRQLLRKFPCSLIYSIEKDELLVLAVAHHRRRPGYWIDRVGQPPG